MQKVRWWFCFALLLGMFLSLQPSESWAGDVRLAVLVAHQKGWKGDPFLRYAIKGDLRPLARLLKQIGFEVIVAENQNSRSIRKLFAKVHRRLKLGPKVNTFMFYYSGHADQHYLHLGPKGKKPLHYVEVATFLSRIRVPRRIAILDACYSGELIRHFGSLKKYRKVLRMARSKGVTLRRSVDLKKILQPHRGKEWGLRILSSSLGLSWEMPKYRASIFTHHLMEGLRGKADLDVDGRVSADELFDYTSRQVKRITGQRPQQLVLIKRESPYALAPAYQGRLLIGKKVVGKIKVAVANFVWTYKKTRTNPMRLAVVTGKGKVYLKRKRRCWVQSMNFPKNREVRLPQRWQKVSCSRLAQQAKGVVSLPARPYIPPPKDPMNSWSLAVNAGVRQDVVGSFSGIKASIDIHLRKRFWGFGLNVSVGQPSGKELLSSRWMLTAMLGYPFRFERASVELFLGAYAQFGMVWLQRGGFDPSLSFALIGGPQVSVSWWWNLRMGLRFTGRVGVGYEPVIEESGMIIDWQALLGLVIVL